MRLSIDPYTSPMLIANSAAVIASLLAFVTLVPQVTKLWRTRDAQGVSATWAAFGVATNGAWTIYLFSQDLWLALPATAAMVVFYALTVGLIARTGQPIVPALMLSSLFALTLAGAGLFGGWAGLGLLLGVSFGIQSIPSVWTAFRTWAPSGISPGTWQLMLVEGVLWLIYGAGHTDRAVVLFGILSSLTSALMLARYFTTRRRWLDPKHASSVRSPV